MEVFNSYGFVIAASVIIILSYFYNLLAKRTNIPSVLLLIITGIIINKILFLLHVKDMQLRNVLEVLGIIGLIMIVLEASLDLKLTRDKSKLIWQTLLISLASLVLTASLVSLIIMVYVNADFWNSLIYAIPISIMSSAIIIPSVSNLSPDKKEFMIYESTFSDILGIMVFYFLLEALESDGFGEVFLYITSNILLTIIISILASSVLILVFQKIKSEVKLFLLIAVLILLYSIGKVFHLSSLLIIIVFGLMLENRHLVLRGKFERYFDKHALDNIYKDFRLVTIESSFIVRTFFFVIFGITISLVTLLDIRVIVVSLLILGIIYGMRFLILKLILKKNFATEWLIAPRGLITILLFYAIPHELQIAEFKAGVLMFIIIFSAILMSISLIRDKKMDSVDVNQQLNTENENDITNL